MAGTAWPALVAGRKCKASQVEDKFDWIEGDIVPMTGGNKTNGVYDLGENSYQWKDGYFSGVVYVEDTSIKVWAALYALLG